MPIRELSLELVHDIVESYGQITKLNLSTNEISRLENLEYLTCLTSLDLFCNHLGSVPGSLDGLAPLTRLTDLDISENSISSLEPLSSAPASLVRLNVGNNCVERIGQVTFLASLTALAELVLAGNPVAAEEGYWAHTCSTLPSLVALDHTPRQDRQHPHQNETLHRATDADITPPRPSPSGTSSPPNAIEEAPALGSSAPLAPLPREDAMMMMSGDQDDGRVERETYPRQEPDRVLERQEPENQSENPPAEPESTLPAPAPSIVSAPAEVPAPAVGSSQGGELLAPAAGDGGEARGIGSRSTEGSAQESSDGAKAEGMAAGVLPRADVLGGPAVPHQDGVGLSGSSVAVEAAAAAGLFESPPESVVAPTAPRRFSAESLTEVNDPFQGRVLAPAATNMVPGNDNRAPAVEPAEAAERKRYHQARPDTWLAESETRSRALLPFASGGGRGLGGDGTREAARRTSGVVSPPSPPQRPLGGSSDWNIALEDQRAAGVGVDTPSEGAAVDHHHRGAAPVPGVQATGRRLEVWGSGSLSGDRRRVVAAAAVSAATTTADRGRIQRNRSGTASDEFSEASESLGRRGPPIFSDRATKHHHDEQHQHHHHHHAAHHHHERHHPAGDGLGLGVADAARSVGDRSKNKGNGLPFEQGRGGVEAPHVPARAAALEVGRSAASLADRLEGSRPAPGGRLEEITGGEGAMVVVVDRGEWEALRRENEDLRRQVDLSGKRCAALTEMQRLADDALSTSNPPLFSGLVSSSTTAQEVSAERRRLREEGGGGGGGGSLSLSSSLSSSAAGEDEGQFRERSGAGVEKDDGTSGGQGWAASAGEQADVAKLLATWRAEVLKLLLQRGADEEAAAAESREARRKVAEEREAREKAEMEAKSLTQRAIAAEADAELSGIKLARAFEELREDRAGRFAAEASSSGYSASVRSLHDWIEGFVGRASKGFFEREAFLARGVAKLEAFSERLAQAAARIEVLGTLLRHKEVQLRNSRAALAADRRVWLLERRDRELAALSKCSARRPPPPVTSASPSHHKQSTQRPGGGGGGDGGDSRVSPYVRIAPGGLPANSRGGPRGSAGGGAWGVVEDEGAAAVQESPLLEGLRPECEAVMRALFCRVDRLGTGAVRALRLLDVLRSDCGVSEVMEAAVGKSRWRAALDSMERALCPPLAGAAGSSDSSGDVGVGGGGSSESGATVPRVERDVTWGEFLLFFLPSAGSADAAYNAGLVHHAGGGNSTGGLPSQTGNSFACAGAGAGAARRQRSAGFGAVSEEAAAMLQMVVPTHWTAGAGGGREERDGEPGTGPRTARGGGAAGGALGRGLAALSVGQLRREVLRLAKERSFLLSLVREDGRLGKRRAEAVHDQYRHELRALHTKIGELERSLEEMSHRTNAEHERGAAVQEELSRLREKMEKSEQEWKRRLDAAVQEKASALAESSREASKAATAARERISRLEAEHSLSLRENGKASVRQRALERELARIKSSMHAEAAVEKEALEERLRAGEAKLATARRERNAMLAALRELQRQSRGHPVSDPVPFFSLTPALGTSQGAGDMLLKDLGDTGGGRGGGGGVGRVIGSSVDSSVGMQEIPQRQAPSSSSPTPAAAAAHESGDASDSEDGPKVVGSKGLGVSELSSGGGRRKEAWQGGGVGRVEREGGGRATSLSARLELLAIQTQQLLEDGSDTSCSSSDDDSG